MLYTETVLMRDPVLDPFFLVGGTALSLQIGHRKSVDLELFTHSDFDTERTFPQAFRESRKKIRARRFPDMER